MRRLPSGDAGTAAKQGQVSIDGVGTSQLEQLLPAPFELTQPNIN